MFPTHIRELAGTTPLQEVLPDLMRTLQSLDPNTPVRLAITGLDLQGAPGVVRNAPLEILITAEHPIRRE